MSFLRYYPLRLQHHQPILVNRLIQILIDYVILNRYKYKNAINTRLALELGKKIATKIEFQNQK